jgi:hypothetical protein
MVRNQVSNCQGIAPATGLTIASLDSSSRFESLPIPRRALRIARLIGSDTHRKGQLFCHSFFAMLKICGHTKIPANGVLANFRRVRTLAIETVDRVNQGAGQQRKDQ